MFAWTERPNPPDEGATIATFTGVVAATVGSALGAAAIAFGRGTEPRQRTGAAGE